MNKYEYEYKLNNESILYIIMCSYHFISFQFNSIQVIVSYIILWQWNEHEQMAFSIWHFEYFFWFVFRILNFFKRIICLLYDICMRICKFQSKNQKSKITNLKP